MSVFHSPKLIFSAAITLRAILLLYGAWQDAHSALKYTDIDYMVFTDAAKYVANGSSPYNRDTYRYPPILAWFLIPTSWGGAWFLFGKVLFALADVLAGFLAFQSLRSSYGLSTDRALKFASVWLLNPMVANISTRGSSEGVLGVLVSGLVWAVLNRRVYLAGVLLGLATHFKIYPFVYGVSIVWWLDSTGDPQDKGLISQALDFPTPKRLKFALSALSTFSLLNLAMYHLYGIPFVHHTFLHHLTRIDHRHNFSPYSTLLYLSASGDVNTGFEGLAFLPQLFLVLVAIPLVLGRRSLTGTLLAQTFAFVGFNKVCTSQVRCPRSILSTGLTVAVFPLVPHLSPILPPYIVIDQETRSGCHCGYSVGCRTGTSPSVCFYQHTNGNRPSGSSKAITLNSWGNHPSSQGSSWRVCPSLLSMSGYWGSLSQMLDMWVRAR